MFEERTRMRTTISESEWAQYHEDGFLMLGRLQDDAEFAALQERMDEIMLGKADLPYDEMLMQLDGETGAYSDLSAQTRWFKQATLNYRKIQDL